MEAKTQKLPGSEAIISISLSKEEFAFYIEKAFLKLSENLEIKGFRKGKVPKDIAEKTRVEDIRPPGIIVIGEVVRLRERLRTGLKIKSRIRHRHA